MATEQPHDLFSSIEGFLKNPDMFYRSGFLQNEHRLQTLLTNLPGKDEMYQEHGIQLSRKPEITKVSVSSPISPEDDEALLSAASGLGTRKVALSYEKLGSNSVYTSSLAKELGFIPRALLQLNLTTNGLIQEAGKALSFDAQADISTNYYINATDDQIVRVLTYPSTLHIPIADREVFYYDPQRRSVIGIPSEAEYHLAKGASGKVVGMLSDAKAKVALRS